MTIKKNQHVVTHPEGWAVKGERNTKATRVVSTQAEARKIAETIAKNNKSEAIIHGKNGRIISSNSYGNDPCPPKDKK